MQNTSDLTAKLLANENLTVVRTNESTASFDVTARVLSLPMWKTMSNELESMLIGHEVGHALYTSPTAWLKAIDDMPESEARIFKQYLNLVEDARIEKLMKRRYPGLRKSFVQGYKELVERDFFGMNGRDPNSMIFADRLNIYFKTGNLNIKFLSDEKKYVNKIADVETFDEVIAITKELYEFCKNNTQNGLMDGLSLEDLLFSVSEDQELEDAEDAIGYDEFEESEDRMMNTKAASTSETPTNKDTPPEISTANQLESNLAAVADTSSVYKNIVLHEELNIDPVVDFKTILNETKKLDDNSFMPSKDRSAESYNKFMQSSERMVSYLVKEFEMRKSATAYKRAQTSKTGSLDAKKLYAYKLKDDIFRRVTTIADGKNHGMIFLLDWSGSMTSSVQPMIEQVINLTMFCRRINLPFEVYAFSDQYDDSDNVAIVKHRSLIYSISMEANKDIVYGMSYFRLLNLFSSRMTNSEFKTMTRRLYDTYRFISGVDNYSLGGTPLNESLLYMLNFIPKYKNTNNVEKLTFITLTDGEGSPLKISGPRSHMDSRKYEGGKYVNYHYLYNDKITGKSYEFKSGSAGCTETLLKIMKDRYDVTSLGFYITARRESAYNAAYRSHFGRNASDTELYDARRKMNSNGFFSILNTGRDELFVIPDNSKIVSDDVQGLEISGSQTAGDIARRLSKMFSTSKRSRVLLDRFIGHVA